jgi:ribosome-binding factor A
MPSRRVLKAAEAIREVVSMAILAELKDPRVEDVTVTYVEVTPDMRQAKVHVSIMGSETKQKLGLRGLQSAAGFLQSKVANRIDTRYTPRLEFVLDMGVKKSIEIAEILQRVLPKDAAAETELEPGSDEPGSDEPAADDQPEAEPDD